MNEDSDDVLYKKLMKLSKVLHFVIASFKKFIQGL